MLKIKTKIRIFNHFFNISSSSIIYGTFRVMPDFKGCGVCHDEYEEKSISNRHFVQFFKSNHFSTINKLINDQLFNGLSAYFQEPDNKCQNAGQRPLKTGNVVFFSLPFLFDYMIQTNKIIRCTYSTIIIRVKLI